MKAPRTAWTAEDDDLLRAIFPQTTATAIAGALDRSLGSVYHRAQKLGLRKSREWIAENSRQAMTNPNHGARRSQFQADQRPWNKGSHYVAGGRSAETRFKPGQKSHSWQPIGHERITKDGYLQRKVTDTGYTPHDYRMVHQLTWIEIHGPVPAGHVVVFRDGNKRNFDIDNLELITRRELMARNTAHRLPPEVPRTVQLLGALRRQINKREGATS